MAFEISINKLDEIVKKLESGDLPLEESVALYEEGIKLAAECKKELDETKQKVKILEDQGDR